MAALGTLVATSSSASAYGVKTSYFQNYDPEVGCLDYRSDVGVYTTRCNLGEYQQWIWNNTPGIATPMRQVATQKCLELKESMSGGWYPGMSTCDSTDRWQRWYVRYPSRGGIPFIVSAAVEEQCLQGLGDGDRVTATWHCVSDKPRVRWRVLSL
ncbi:RICIN domain-containing protein [Streptomyces jeddahensis]|nr:hypothetical protein [Streptomyces jeddahensis]